MFQITITAESAAELHNKISGLYSTFVTAPDVADEPEAGQDVAPEAEQSTETPNKTTTTPAKSKGSKKSKAKTDDKVGSEDDQPDLPIEDTAEPEPEPEVAPEDPEPEAPAIVDVDTLRDQLMKYAEQHGNTKAKALCGEWGKVSAIPEDQRNRIYVEAGGEL